jgi:hypothetical protein
LIYVTASIAGISGRCQFVSEGIIRLFGDYSHEKLGGRICGACCFCFSISSCGASAATITYIFTGPGSWTLNGVAESGDFTVTYLGDTSTVGLSGGEYSNPVTGVFSFDSTTVKLTGGATEFLITRLASPGFVGFEQVTETVLLPPTFNVAVEALTGTPFETYNLATSFPLTSGGLCVGPATYFTSGGDLVFAADSITSHSLQAIVPEPSTWATMLAGFVGLGFVGYRRSIKARAAA